MGKTMQEYEKPKRVSIIHIQNLFFSSQLQIKPVRETGKYIIAYEPKFFSAHRLLFKIDKKLFNNNSIDNFNNTLVDINVREDYRSKIKATDSFTNGYFKNITCRVSPTRYTNFTSLYASIQVFGWRHTHAGGLDKLNFSIPECPLITNSTTISGVCYKIADMQISRGGTHGTITYIIVAPQRGEYNVGNWHWASNYGKSTKDRPVTVKL